jgi:hypothetical protein
MMLKVNSSGKEISKLILKSRLVKKAEVEDYKNAPGENLENPLAGFFVYNNFEARSLTKQVQEGFTKIEELISEIEILKYMFDTGIIVKTPSLVSYILNAIEVLEYETDLYNSILIKSMQ